MVLEPFSERFPDRFFNVGVAEQNMVGIATGLAEAGFVPFVYSIATFASMRPYEFIRNGPVLHDLPVRIVGVGGGFDYGHNGITHFALEDYRADARSAGTDGGRAGRRAPGSRRAAGDARAAGPGLLPGRQAGHVRCPASTAASRSAGPADRRGRRRRADRDRLDRARGAVARRSCSPNTASPRPSRSSRRSIRSPVDDLAELLRSECRWRSRSRRTTSTAGSARWSPRRSPSTGWAAG